MGIHLPRGAVTDATGLAAQSIILDTADAVLAVRATVQSGLRGEALEAATAAHTAALDACVSALVALITPLIAEASTASLESRASAVEASAMVVYLLRAADTITNPPADSAEGPKLAKTSRQAVC
jgi:hypothetical protein